MRYSTLSRALLQFLAVSGEIMIDAFLFPHPKTRMARALLGLDPYKKHYSSPKTAKHSLSSMLHHLKKQGLVAVRGPNKKAVWNITKKGQKALGESLPPKHQVVVDDLPPKDGIARLVAFDVPEKEREKRQWLRTTLIACGFEPIQRSVFLGWRALPEDAIKEISDMNMDRYVHIMSIQKPGTLHAQRRKPI